MILNELFRRKKKAQNEQIEEVKEIPCKQSHPLEEPERFYFPEDANDVAILKTNIAGITKHLKMADARKPYSGHTEFDPNNPIDKKAVKLVTDDGRMMGYIPAIDLRLYYDIFGSRDHIRFHGAVGLFTNGSGKKTLFGRIMLVDIPESDDGTLFNLAQKQLDYMMSEFSTE